MKNEKKKRIIISSVSVVMIIAIAIVIGTVIKKEKDNNATVKEEKAITIVQTQADRKNIADSQSVEENKVEKGTESTTSSENVSSSNNDKNSETIDNTAVDNEPKEDCSIIEGKDFVPGTVTVVYKKAASKYGKIHTADEFPGVEIESMEDMTANAVNNDNFRQIYIITLKDKSKEGAIYAVNTIKDLDYVKYVGLNYIETAELL